MASAFRRGLCMIFGLVGRERRNQELKTLLADHDREFLKRVLDPHFGDGSLLRLYNEEVARIKLLHDQRG